MTNRLFPDPQYPAVPVVGTDDLYPVHRIFCVGRNYAEHAKEMGMEVDRDAAFYFMKDAQALVQNGSDIAYPPCTSNYHFEMEFVVVIGKPLWKATADELQDAVFGYACGLDLTRRDLQLVAREKGRPWDFGKNFETSAVLGPITPKAAFGTVGDQEIRLEVNGTLRQKALLSELIWSVEEILLDLSQHYHLKPGDVIYTGTPAGVGALQVGDRLHGEVDGLAAIDVTITQAL